MKIDTEGYDLHILKGAQELLSRQKIGIIQFEYMWAWSEAGSTLKWAMRYLDSFGYKIFFLRKDGLYTFLYDKFGEDIRGGNFVAVSEKWNRVAEKL